MTKSDTPQSDTSMNGQSLNIAEQKRKELEQLFPGIFTETRNDRGELKKTVDVERLKAELGEFTDIYDSRRERYGLEWPGKRDCLRLIQDPSTATLKPCREESVDFDTTENLFIEGDNLEVLKLLQKSYYGKVKMIYIDPPYNTGKEFIYPDNFSESLDTYLQYAGLKDSEGRTFSTNTANEGRFHTKWLNMMYPRLYLARNLLREDGVIFISIDDNEVENLRRMCDEIFGEENFVATIVWQKTYSPSNDKKGIDAMHDYVIAYRRSGHFENKLIPRSEKQNNAYTNADGDPRGPWKAVDSTRAEHRDYAFYPITTPSGKVVYPSKGRSWVFTSEECERLRKENRLWFGKNGESKPSIKRFLTDVKTGVVPTTWWPFDVSGHNDSSKKEIKKLFPDFDPFDTPKPTKLIKRLGLLSLNNDDIVLDFFSGSSTTANAILDLAREQSKSFKFIMVQLPEPTDENTERYRAGFKTISDVSKERIRRAAEKIRQEIESELELEDTKRLDLGFKVLKLNQSNFKLWQAPAKDISDDELLQQMELNVDHIDPNASQEDLLYELLIKAGVRPTEKVELIELAGHTLFSVGEGSLLVHLEDAIDQALIDAVLAKAPSQFICLDKAFHGNDQLKTNAVKTFEAFNQGKEKIDQIDFRTV
jgi:adenine-specific DNA-methyltransferase